MENPKSQPLKTPLFKEGQRVEKVGGDYTFEGVVVSVFRKLTGAPRYVVENQEGLLHIFGGQNLVLAEEQPPEG